MLSMSPRRVTAYVPPVSILEGHALDVRATAERLREVIREALPDASEVGYPGWHAIGYRRARGGRICAIFPLDRTVQLVFEWGTQLHDPDGRLLGTTKQTRYLEYGSPDRVDSEMLTSLLLEASALHS